jgi:hypothetical protein
MLPTDWPVALGIEGAAPFSSNGSGARNPGRLERTGDDHPEGEKGGANDDIPHHSRLLFSFVHRVRPLVGQLPRTVQTRFVRGVAS